MLRKDLEISMIPAPGSPPVRWRVAHGLVDYTDAVATMEREVADIAEGAATSSCGWSNIRHSIPAARAPIRPT